MSFNSALAFLELLSFRVLHFHIMQFSFEEIQRRLPFQELFPVASPYQAALVGFVQF